MKTVEEMFAAGAGTMIGMVHCLPLPGTLGFDGDYGRILEQAKQDAVTLERAGADAVIVENMGDTPFAASMDVEQVCALAAAAACVRQAVKIPVGIDAAFNDCRAALSIAAAVGGAFIRVPVFVDTVLFTDGIISPCARQCMMFRKHLRAENIRVLADIQVKHTVMLSERITPEDSARMAAECGADVILVTGSRTGEETPLDLIKRIKQTVRIPVYAASGVTADNVREQLKTADGAIVGSGFKKGGVLSNPVDYELARKLLARAKEREEQL
jgi:membrane complex biogenesis BtpA family protein